MNPEEIAAFIQEHEHDATPEAIKDALVSSGVSEESFENIWNSFKGIVPQKTRVEQKVVPAMFQQPAVVVNSGEGPWEKNLLGGDTETTKARAVKTIFPMPVQRRANAVEKSAASMRVSVVAGILASFLLGGGAFAYWSFIPQRLTPTQVFENMFAALATIDSANYSGSFSLSVDTERSRASGQATAVYDLIAPLMLVQNDTNGQEAVRIDLDFSGGFDQSNPVNNKMTLHTKVAGMFMGSEYNFEMDARMTDKKMYTKFDNISVLDPKLKEIENMWIRSDVSMIEQSMLRATSASTTISEVETVPSHVQEKITEIFSNAEFFTIRDLKSGVTSNGISAHHYRMEVNKEELKRVMTDVLDIVYENGVPTNKSLGNLPMTKDRAHATISDAIDILQDVRGEIWVGKEDFLPHEALLQVTISDPETSTGIHFNMTIQLADFNKPLIMTVPTDFMTMEEMLPVLNMGVIEGEGQGSQTNDLGL